jgi:hypothetical protein
MKKSLQIQLNDNTSSAILVNVINTKETTLKIKDFLKHENESYFLSISHNQLNTHLNLTNILNPYILIYLDEELRFTGASFCINYNESPFGIQSQNKHVLFSPFPTPFKFQQFHSINFL